MIPANPFACCAARPSIVPARLPVSTRVFFRARLQPPSSLIACNYPPAVHCAPAPLPRRRSDGRSAVPRRASESAAHHSIAQPKQRLQQSSLALLFVLSSAPSLAISRMDRCRLFRAAVRVHHDIASVQAPQVQHARRHEAIHHSNHSHGQLAPAPAPGRESRRVGTSSAQESTAHCREE